MSKSYYILLTLVAATVAVFFLGRWTGMGLGLNSQRVTRTVHEAWCRADDRHALCPEAGLDSLFRQQLREGGLRRLRFRLDTVSLSGDSTVVLRSALRYFDDYERELEQRRTFVIPLDSLQGVRARLLNLRAETVGSQLYYLLGTVAGFFLLAFGIFKQVDIIQRQDKLFQMREDFSYAMVHDMKNPISTLLMAVKNLRSGRLDDKPDRKREHFDLLERESRRGGFLTASTLCARTGILKSQMNAILRSLETSARAVSSASTFIACGLIELSKLVSGKESDDYMAAALKLLKTLHEERNDYTDAQDIIVTRSSEAYHRPAHETAIIYADYYYLEALLKLKGKALWVW